MNREIATRAVAWITVFVTATGVSACQQPPELPPADSMTFFEFKRGEANVVVEGDEASMKQMALSMDGVVASGSTANVDTAALSVGLVSLGVHLALAAPRLLFAAVLSAGAEHDRGSDTWTWEKSMPLAGWKGRMTGKLRDKLELEMFVTGLRDQQAKDYQDFKWYTGSHDLDNGRWQIFAKDVSGPVLNIDWEHSNVINKKVSFTNVTTGTPESGDTLAYALAGNVASMTIRDATGADGKPASFSVFWDVVEGEGRILRGGSAECWDTLAKGQIDIPCPTGAWPTP